MQTSPDAPTLTERLEQLVAEFPTAPALSCGPTTLTRSDLLHRSRALGAELRSRGVQQGDLVTALLPNGTAPLVVAFAAWGVGAVPQLLSPDLPDREVHELLELGRPKVVVSDGRDLPGALTVLPSTAVPITTVEHAPLPRRVSPAWKAPTSGGSTGRPKIIVAGQPALWERVAGLAELLRLPEHGCVLVTAPVSHNAPFLVASLAVLQGGHALVMPRFDAEEVLRLVQEHRVAWAYAVPAMMARIWRLPDDVRGAYDVSSLDVLMHMAAPCAPSLKRAFLAWLGPQRVLELYAGTEVQAATLIDGEEWLAHPGSVGRPVVGRMQVRDDEGRELSPGETGRLWMLRDPGTPPTYSYVGATAVRDEDGWETLGDRGWIDADGYLHLADRDSDMLLVGGVNVYPAEIEAVLLEHPAVLEACVVGRPHPDLGEVPHAFIRGSRAMALQELHDLLDRSLPGNKRPRTVEVVDEPLRDPAGKVRRSALRDRARADAAVLTTRS